MKKHINEKFLKVGTSDNKILSEYISQEQYNLVFEFFEAEAAKGDMAAKYNLASCYQKGLGTERNLNQAISLYTETIGHNNNAEYNIGNCYLAEPSKENVLRAKEFYQKAFDKGFAKAEYKLDLCSYIISNSNITKKQLKTKLEPKRAKFYYNLAEYYKYNNEDSTNVVSYYKKSAKEGYIKSQYKLANIKYKLNSIKEAIEWFVAVVENKFDNKLLKEEALKKLNLMNLIPKYHFRLFVKSYFESINKKIDEVNPIASLEEEELKNLIESLTNLYAEKAPKVNEFLQKNIKLKRFVNGKRLSPLPREKVVTATIVPEKDLSSIGLSSDIIEAIVVNDNEAELGILEHKAEKGEINSIIQLSNHYSSIGVYDKAFFYFLKGAEQGAVGSFYNLGLCYEKGLGVSQNLEQAKHCYMKAESKGYTALQYYLGNFCLNIGQTDEAIEWFNKAAEYGDPRAISVLGVNENSLSSFESAMIQYKLALNYLNGIGINKDSAQAVHWYNLSAMQGLAIAQFHLALCYDNGEGVEQNKSLAVYWYNLSAMQGLVVAQFHLALCYDNGEGVEQNKSLAVWWYERAAAQGLPEAQYNLGICYKNAEGVEKDDNLALYWFEQAAWHGDKEAQFEVAGYYLVSGNKDLAISWLIEAANQGHKQARDKLNNVSQGFTAELVASRVKEGSCDMEITPN